MNDDEIRDAIIAGTAPDGLSVDGALCLDSTAITSLPEGLSVSGWMDLFAAGITILFTAQTLLIMGGVTKLLPLTGVTLPFVSYGGSSLLISGVMLGLLMFVSGTVDDTTF